MMLGIGMMLAAIAGSVSKDEAAAVGGWGIGFLALSVVLLAVIGIAAVREQLAGVVARDVQNELAGESSKVTPNTCDTSDTPNTPDDNDLSDTERALIKLLRNSDIPARCSCRISSGSAGATDGTLENRPRKPGVDG